LTWHRAFPAAASPFDNASRHPDNDGPEPVPHVGK
jgi:hypothetical protein